MEFYNTKQKINQEELNAFCEVYSVSLPDDYVEHILRYNGGYPSLDFFKEYNIGAFKSIKYGSVTLESSLDALAGSLPEGLFPFAHSPTGSLFCLDLRPETFGKVYIVHLDMGEPVVIYLAESFTEFIDGLTEEWSDL